MKAAATLLLLVCLQANAQSTKSAPAKPAFDAPQSFQAIVAQASDTKLGTHVFLNTQSKWIKQFFYVGEVRYDVKKTDSLITPIVGMVSFPVEMKAAGPFDSREEAESAITPTRSVSQYAVDGTYHVRENAWRLSEFKYRDSDASSPLAGSQFTATPEKLVAGGKETLYPILKNWVR